jgi:hypothetical protein
MSTPVEVYPAWTDQPHRYAVVVLNSDHEVLYAPGEGCIFHGLEFEENQEITEGGISPPYLFVTAQLRRRIGEIGFRDRMFLHTVTIENHQEPVFAFQVSRDDCVIGHNRWLNLDNMFAAVEGSVEPAWRGPTYATLEVIRARDAQEHFGWPAQRSSHDRNELNADKLTMTLIPEPNATFHELLMFAASFNSFKHLGFEATANIANQGKRESLSELCTSLYFECRRVQHLGGYPNAKAIEYIRALVAAIRAIVRVRSFWEKPNSQ